MMDPIFRLDGSAGRSSLTILVCSFMVSRPMPSFSRMCCFFLRSVGALRRGMAM